MSSAKKAKRDYKSGQDKVCHIWENENGLKIWLRCISVMSAVPVKLEFFNWEICMVW